MTRDPIVDEVRAAGAALAEQAGDDLHRLCELLRERQARNASRLIRLRPRRKTAQASGSEALRGADQAPD